MRVRQGSFYLAFVVVAREPGFLQSKKWFGEVGETKESTARYFLLRVNGEVKRSGALPTHYQTFISFTS